MRPDDYWESMKDVRIMRPGPMFGLRGYIERLYGGSSAFDSTRAYRVLVQGPGGVHAVVINENEMEEWKC